MPPNARAIAAHLGIDELVAEALPKGKVDVFRRLKTEHSMAAVIGDGINGTHALAEAELAWLSAPARTSPIKAADVVLMLGSRQGVQTRSQS